MSVKISELPAVTTIDNSDILPVVKAGVTSKILFSSLKTLLGFQASNANLDIYAGITPTAVGQNVLALASPIGASYLKISNLGVPQLKTASEVLSDIGAQAHSTNLDEYAGVNPGLPGLNVLRLDAPATTGYVRVSSGIDSDVFVRTPTQVRSDIGAFASASLDDDATLGGLLANSTKAASQLAIKRYVDAVRGVPATLNDDNVSSAATINLDAATGNQIGITGAIGVTAITLAEKATKTLVFDNALTFTASATLVLPGGLTTLTTESGGVANVLGGAGGLVTILDYQSPARGTIANIIGGAITGLTDFALTASASKHMHLTYSDPIGNGETILNFKLGASGTTSVRLNSSLISLGVAPYTLTLPVSANTSATLPPGTHNIASEVGNYSATAQTPAATTRTYISGSAISVPDSGLLLGSKFSWKFNMTKTAAGSATSTFDICVGTAGTTADTARVSFTKPAGSAVVDEGFVIIEAVVKGPISATGVIIGEFIMCHNLASTGHLVIPMACVHTDSSAFDLTTSGLIIGVCITTGASDAITINQVSSQAFNL